MKKIIRVDRKLFEQAIRIENIHRESGVPLGIRGKEEIAFVNKYYYTPINQSLNREVWYFGNYVEIR